MCISITGGMPEEFRERISKKYSKNSKVFNDNKFLKTWKGNQIELRTKSLKLHILQKVMAEILFIVLI